MPEGPRSIVPVACRPWFELVAPKPGMLPETLAHSGVPYPVPRPTVGAAAPMSGSGRNIEPSVNTGAAAVQDSHYSGPVSRNGDRLPNPAAVRPGRIILRDRATEKVYMMSEVNDDDAKVSLGFEAAFGGRK